MYRKEIEVFPGIRLLQYDGSQPAPAMEPGYSSILYIFHEGMALSIDTSLAPSCMSCFLEGVTVKPCSLAEKFCRKKGGCQIGSNPKIKRIFTVSKYSSCSCF